MPVSLFATGFVQAQITVDDLTAFDTTPGLSLDIGGDGNTDFKIDDLDPDFAGLSTTGASGATFFGDTSTGGFNFENSGEGFQSGDNVAFPTDDDYLTAWYSPLGDTIAVNGYVFGTDNWVAFKDTEDHYGWLGFGLRAGGDPDLHEPIMKAFVYDPTSTSTSTAITLGQAVDAWEAASVPEPSSLLLMALGSVTILRRKRS
ncbi:MAG: PEP-CTERM sorting domain-containing protein [Verrucomicrobiaceae bacterium]